MTRVLIIDDEEDIVRLLEYTLKRAGHEVDLAKNGMEGLDKFQDAPFDVVITDIRMPVLDGYHVAHHIRNSSRPGVPIIAISGTRLAVKTHAFNCVLFKPFSLNRLLKTIVACCANPLDGTACA
jgi:DNA-binding response OmpR family regulator